MSLSGSLVPALGRDPAPLVLGIEIFYDEPRSGRESWREQLQEAVLEEIDGARCFTDVTVAPEPAELLLSVRLLEHSILEESGGEPRFDERTGRTHPGRSYLCRIRLAYALLRPGETVPLHEGRFSVASRQATSANPLFEPREYALRATRSQAAQKLRRKVCRRAARIARLLGAAD